jgi:uncharacterized protein (TIGR03435 family)
MTSSHSKRPLRTALWLSFLFAKLLPAQAFEAASISPHSRNEPSCYCTVKQRSTAGRVESLKIDTSLQALVAWAYHAKVVDVHGPQWTIKDSWDITARAADPASPDELRVMLRHLLETRFQLKVNVTKRPGAVCTLSIAPGGFKGVKSDSGTTAQIITARDPDGSQMVTATSFSMDDFSGFVGVALSPEFSLCRDETHVERLFDFKLHFFGLPTDQTPAGEHSPVRPSFMEAVHTQVGVQVKKARGPVDSIEILEAAPPTAN